MHGVSVTGSERAGAAVAEIAGRNLKKVVLELGGSDPFIVLGTDDVGAVAEQAAEARLENTGQACNAAKRFIVKDEYYDEFLAKLKEQIEGIKTGDPTERGHDARAALLEDRRRPARGPGQAGDRRRCRGGRRRQARRQLLRADDPHRDRAGRARPPRKSSSARSRRSTRLARRRRRSASPTTPSSGSAPT